jgi:hypothetical protein
MVANKSAVSCYDCCAKAKGGTMSKKVIDLPGARNDQEDWTKALNELNAEIAASQTLTEEEKHFLLEEMDALSDEEWEPITCAGEPISETIIQSRGER